MSARSARLSAAAAALIVAVGVAVDGLAAGAASAATISAASAASAAKSDVGLFGSQDPTYDGVYRQSLAIIGLTAVGKTPDANAVNWLLTQQCADGAFTAYRADPSIACTSAAEDENATAMAIQALVVLGKPTAAAVTALKHFQLNDGGFYDNTVFGAAASDANSTGLALSALVAAGIDPTSVTAGGKDGDDYLRSIQLPCSTVTGAGAYDFQPEKVLAANDYATVQALLGQLGHSLPVAPTTVATTVPACTDPTDAATSATAAVSYLAARLLAAKGAIPSSLGSGTDWTSTANAVLDLVAAQQGADAVKTAGAALATNVKAYAQTGGAYGAGPLGTLLLVAHATGVDPTAFGGVDLATALFATERTAATPAPTPTPTPTSRPVPSPSPTGSAAGAAGPSLPMTGAHGVLPLTALGSALLVLGALAVAAGRRRAGDGTP